MPTRTLQRFAVFSVEDIYTNFLSGAPGWTGGSSEDIKDISWDDTLRTLSFFRTIERSGTIQGLQRKFTVTAAEIVTIVSGLPNWGGITAADIDEVRIDPAGRKIIVVKTSEAA